MKTIPMRVVNEAPDQREAEIMLHDVIGEDMFGGVSSKNFSEQLKSFGALDTITVRINSPGGNVFDGNAIYNALKNHSDRKSVV